MFLLSSSDTLGRSVSASDCMPPQGFFIRSTLQYSIRTPSYTPSYLRGFPCSAVEYGSLFVCGPALLSRRGAHDRIM